MDGLDMHTGNCRHGRMLATAMVNQASPTDAMVAGPKQDSVTLFQEKPMNALKNGWERGSIIANPDMHTSRPENLRKLVRATAAPVKPIYKETERWREVALSYQHSGEACRTARAWRAAGLSYAQSGNAYKNASMWMGAEESYCNAKMAYAEAGAYEDSGNMYYEEMVMKRMRVKKRSLKRLISYLYDLVCGYGEKPKNVVIGWIVIILFFALIYLFPSGLTYSGETSSSFLIRAFHALYFSTITFATLGYGSFEPKGYMLPFVMAEALLGIFMIVLFVFVFSRKMMRR